MNFIRPTLFLCCMSLTGCISIPPVPPANTSAREALESHVQFLAQPALKGRKPGSRGSGAARTYIQSRFKACGLVPWGDESSYALSFGRGKNVVGVLRGSDPAL